MGIRIRRGSGLRGWKISHPEIFLHQSRRAPWMPPAQPPTSQLLPLWARFPPLAKHGWGGPCQGGNRTPRISDTGMDKRVLSGSERTSAGLRATAQGRTRYQRATKEYLVICGFPRSWTPALVALGVCKRVLGLGPCFPAPALGTQPFLVLNRNLFILSIYHSLIRWIGARP